MANDQRSHSEKSVDKSAERGSHSDQQKKIDSETAPKNREGNPNAEVPTGGQTGGSSR